MKFGPDTRKLRFGTYIPVELLEDHEIAILIARAALLATDPLTPVEVSSLVGELHEELVHRGKTKEQLEAYIASVSTPTPLPQPPPRKWQRRQKQG